MQVKEWSLCFVFPQPAIHAPHTPATTSIHRAHTMATIGGGVAYHGPPHRRMRLTLNGGGEPVALALAWAYEPNLVGRQSGLLGLRWGVPLNHTPRTCTTP